VGKTNLLDAIHYLCLTKSYFAGTDAQNIRHGENFIRIDGNIIDADSNNTIVYKLQQGKRKEFLVNDRLCIKASEYVGMFPVVMITPDDNQLVLGSSEERRRFVDNTISQISREYLEDLMQYNKVLQLRNAALKSFAETGRVDKGLLEVYDQQLTPPASRIFEMRTKYLEQLEGFFNQIYPTISLQREAASFIYQSQLKQQTFSALLASGLQRDLALQRTDFGIHKDDLEFYLDGTRLKRFGSQGQQKSFIIALKLAQYHFIRSFKKVKPLLLVDDIFDKLDRDRSSKLLEMLTSENVGQVFITDTDPLKIKELTAHLPVQVNFIEL